MNQKIKATLFLLFFGSGFCSLLYQVVWLRLAFAHFGIITPILSIVLSVFMLGLALGSWVGGKVIEPLVKKSGLSAAYFYALAELMIGIGAFVLPKLFAISEKFLLSAGDSNSTSYLLQSALALALCIFPWTFFMGTTFPLMMAFVKKQSSHAQSSFSFLYLANVIGAMVGTLTSAVFLVESFGFSGTLLFGAITNFVVAGLALALGFTQKASAELATQKNFALESSTAQLVQEIPWISKPILFTTGLTSMGMEVVWTRAFAPVVKTQVYSFALLLFVYLLATWVGSIRYRAHLQKQKVASLKNLLWMLALSSLLPLLLTDPRLHLKGAGIIFGIFPFCALLGYLTPKIMDEISHGAPEEAGRSYALNILGCILGPLVASYLLLPWLGVKISIVLLALPFFVFAFLALQKSYRRIGFATFVPGFALLILVITVFGSKTYEEMVDPSKGEVLKRDHTATIVARGTNLDKMLYVNGIGITTLTSITKVMAHLPLLSLDHPPESALVICFGMGTTFRSLLTWDIQTTAVELVPSVREVFSYFHSDANTYLNNPKGKVVIDDGRRFLKRNLSTYDLITLDPPPPVEAAGSSLLYSKEFYDLVKTRLKPDGLLQQWLPAAEPKIAQAVTRSLVESFPYVRVFDSFDNFGRHYLAAMHPIHFSKVEELMAKFPAAAQKDLVEWQNGKSPQQFLTEVLAKEIPVSRVLNPDESLYISDDRPFNEYHALRRFKDGILKRRQVREAAQNALVQREVPPRPQGNSFSR